MPCGAPTNTTVVKTLTNVENITFAGNGINYVVGSDAANVITGGTGTDWIVGGAGDDTIIDGAGADNLTGGTGADTFQIIGSAADAANVITDFSVAQGDIIDLSANAADTAGGTALTNYAELATGAAYTAAATATGFVVIGANIAGTTEANVQTLLGAGNVFFAGAATDKFYLAADNGTDTFVFLVESAAANQLFTAAEDTSTLILTISGLADATTLSAANFADFA